MQEVLRWQDQCMVIFMLVVNGHWRLRTLIRLAYHGALSSILHPEEHIPRLRGGNPNSVTLCDFVVITSYSSLSSQRMRFPAT